MAETETDGERRLTWQEPERWHQKSEEGYGLCKALVHGVPVYLAWPPKPTYNRNATDWRENLHSPIGKASDPETARNICQQHFNASNKSR